MMESKQITFSIDSSLKNVALVGLSINKICSQIPLTNVEAYQIEACVVEAINNTIEHAYQNKKGHVISIKVNLFLDRIAFQISDTGLSMEAELSPSLNFDPEDIDNLPESGMGLFIIHEVMDKVAYVSDADKNILEMSKIFGDRV